MTKLIRQLFRRLYLLCVPTYRRLELRLCTYGEADSLIRQNGDKPDHERWVIATPEEDRNPPGTFLVYLERRERITQ